MAASKQQAFWNHPAGPKTIHFWAPTAKWVISIANIADFSKPSEIISYPQQTAVTFTGLIWSRYSLVITPAWLVSSFEDIRLEHGFKVLL
ncbi:mitochondrial pyruvate carrier 4-like isoform X1 [Juglans regia]|uniref:Mitochondrial pyruvate carrier n=1 Tax=Juglans regia TaxID=51240 RepID=A0A2I4ESN1_JUGRE|nr:mitochondrial pyruvate carrier 4-like isoform X1 [Juglans regia]